jgi:hypothetical protein
MLIDEILDRRDGKKYKAKDFYNYCMKDEIYHDVAEALDNGEEKDIKKILCKYIMKEHYNPFICDYINSVNWL